MAAQTEEYKHLVLDDIRTYEGLSHPVKANIAERLLIRKAPISKIHPNPEDEFCNPKVGPNYSIVSDYQKNMIFSLQNDLPVLKERLVVEKMSTGGYMLLNGHHRWMAATRIGLWKVPIEIVNVTHTEDILAVLSQTDRKICVSIDLDEVLLTDGTTIPADRELPWPLKQIYKETLRKNAGILVNELQKAGADVWVYTGKYYSQQWIDGLFSLHKAHVDGIVNGLEKNGSKKSFQQMFCQKYLYSVHIDNNSLLCVNTGTKEFESYDLSGDETSWAAEVIKQLRTLKLVQKNADSRKS